MVLRVFSKPSFTGLILLLAIRASSAESIAVAVGDTGSLVVPVFNANKSEGPVAAILSVSAPAFFSVLPASILQQNSILPGSTAEFLVEYEITAGAVNGEFNVVTELSLQTLSAELFNDLSPSTTFEFFADVSQPSDSAVDSEGDPIPGDVPPENWSSRVVTPWC